MIGKIEVEQCMVHPQLEHNPLSRSGENERALRWNKSLDTKTGLTQIFMFLQTAPVRHGTHRLWSLINYRIWKDIGL